MNTYIIGAKGEYNNKMLTMTYVICAKNESDALQMLRTKTHFRDGKDKIEFITLVNTSYEGLQIENW